MGVATPPGFYPDDEQQQATPPPGESPGPPRRGRHHAAAPDVPPGQQPAYDANPRYGQENATVGRARPAGRPPATSRPREDPRQAARRPARPVPRGRSDLGTGDFTPDRSGWVDLVPTGEVWYYREPSGPTDPESGGFIAPQRRRPPTGPHSRDPDPRRTTGGRHSGALSGGGSRRSQLIGVAAVVAVVVVVGGILLTHKLDSSKTGANALPTSTPSATSAKKTPPSKPAGPVYTLSTPATAGSYPVGQDPTFLGEATTTARSFVSAVASGGGGKAQGTPVSASYNLGDAQTMEFVGYQGSFNPAKVAVILKSLGTDPAAYPAGPHGGMLGCYNTSATPSGAVCVWATTSTLGVVEFFEGTGPETLVTAQAKGASDTLQLRSGVETLKSKSAKS